MAGTISIRNANLAHIVFSFSLNVEVLMAFQLLLTISEKLVLL